MAALPEPGWVARTVPTRQIVARANSLEATLAVVRAGVGRALPPAIFAKDESLIAIAPQPVLARELWLCVHEDSRKVPRVRAIMDFPVETVHAACARGSGSDGLAQRRL